LKEDNRKKSAIYAIPKQKKMVKILSSCVSSIYCNNGYEKMENIQALYYQDKNKIN
jgi:hypothetical protein